MTALHPTLSGLEAPAPVPPRPQPRSVAARRSVSPRRSLSPLLVNTAAVGAASVVASVLYSGPQRAHDLSLQWLALFDVVLLGILVVRRTHRFRLSGTVLDELSPVAVATAIAVVVVIALRAFVSPEADAALQVLRWGALAAVSLAVVHVGAHRHRRRRFLAGGGHGTLIVGAGTVGRQIARRFMEHPELGLRPVGFLDKEPLLDDRSDLRLPVLGASWDLESRAMAYDVDHVVVAFSTAPHGVLVDIVRRSHALGLHVLIVPRLFEEVPLLGNTVEFAGGIPLQRVEPAARGWRLTTKYVVDRVGAGLALVVAMPLLVTAAVAVRCTSSGPVFFRQRRVGLDGREFDMLKFRTMKGSPDVAGEADAGWALSIAGGEPAADAGQPVVDRRTAVGRLLRKFSLDEMPQLINVVRGEMSLVGPRPERASLVPAFNRNVYRYADRHRMKGGMTGWAQVNDLRGETSLVDRVEWDNRYIQHWSPWLDLKIVLLTVPAMLRGS